MSCPTTVNLWAVKGIGGVLDLIEQQVRSGTRPEGEAAELLRMYAARLELAAAGEQVPPALRKPAEFWAWLHSENLQD